MLDTILKFVTVYSTANGTRDRHSINSVRSCRSRSVIRINCHQHPAAFLFSNLNRNTSDPYHQ